MFPSTGRSGSSLSVKTRSIFSGGTTETSEVRPSLVLSTTIQVMFARSGIVRPTSASASASVHAPAVAESALPLSTGALDDRLSRWLSKVGSMVSQLDERKVPPSGAT